MGAKNAVQTEEVNVAAEQEAIENLLDDLNLDSVEPEAIEEIVVENTDEEIVKELVLADEELGDLDLSIAREEAYESQASTVETNTQAAQDAKAAAPVKGGATRASRKTTGTSTPRTPRADLASMDAAHFVLEGDVASMSDEDKNAAKAATLAKMPSQKKIAEKFENLFQALAAGKQPSVYVVGAFKLLDGKKTMTSSDLVTHFKTSYSQGTSMSQAGQIMNLFDTVGIASRSKNTLTLNANSVIAERLRAVIGA